MRLSSLAVAVCSLASVILAQTPVVSANGETMRLGSSSVTAAGAAWNVTLTMGNDNNNAGLGSTFRRWWHCQINNLNPAGVTLNVTVNNAGYNDVILPVWSLSTNGTAFGAYARAPLSATPSVNGSGTVHTFTLQVPPGVIAIRLAKYFPYTVARKDAWLASLSGQPHVRSIVTLGNSVQGRPVQKVEFTDASVPDAGKVRIWIHAGIHPSETTSYFTVEGLVAWLLSGDPYAEVLLDHALIELVPMANPDGVALGNYRTNANSSNLENEWAAPYTSPQPEIIAMRTAIEGYMGTVASPGSNPIRVLLNLHSSHNVAYPFHFQHTANANWNPTTNNSGVLPIVNQIEGQWISAFRARSPFVTLGATQSSTAGAPSRPFVESMSHDRWTAQNGWLNAPGFQDPVMAITFEGTYGMGPNGVSWNTEADYNLCGQQLGLALCDYFGLTPTASATAYGVPCGSVALTGTVVPQAGGGHLANLSITGAVPNAFALLVGGSAPVAVPLPAPWSACTLLAAPDVTVGFLLDATGSGALALAVPPAPGLSAYLQCLAFDITQPSLPLDASAGLHVANDY